MRITIDLPENLAHALASRAKRLGVSRAELISQAVAAYLRAHRAPLVTSQASRLNLDVEMETGTGKT